MTTVRYWTGKEVRALRMAKRMSVREFAAHLGVSARIVSRWEAAGERIHPRPVNQAALDTSLAHSNADVRARFSLLVATSTGLEDAEEPGGRVFRHPADGKRMLLVPAGTFLSGPDNQPMWLPGFYIDAQPTTNVEYARFVEATGHRPPPHWDDVPDTRGMHPVVSVNWRDAQAYAIWAGKALPTAAQWEKAARGAHGDVYPWGGHASARHCNARESCVGTTTPVDAYPEGTSPFGVLDLCGNVWEWSTTVGAPGSYLRKGGSFAHPLTDCAPFRASEAAADVVADDTGFRCVVG
ncbi:MAG: SUMF1/EgtB/PvdO family nonheme iron enzyme [Actinophytocola sp.]|nr:SUMF1/EgtB/PvdO family nonheme iron enzyme [Actinophytocola sp.]